MIDKEIRYIKGVGERRAALFKKRGIKTVRDMLYFFPRSHEDRGQTKLIGECRHGETVCIKAKVYDFVRVNRIRPNMTIFSMIVTDESGAITIIWYNNRFVKDVFDIGDVYNFYGKIALKGSKLEMITPVYEKDGQNSFTGKIIPIYPLTGGLTQKVVQKTMQEALKEAGQIEEYIPDKIRDKYRIAEINYSLRNIHFPDNFESYNIARRRFIFEELMVLQLALLDRKEIFCKQDGVKIDGSYADEFIKKLPFPLTNAQDRTIREILKDCASGKQMNRLVQGDVGSGKTAVAAAVIYAAVKNGHQAAMMAPTEILASQHLETLEEFFKDMGITVVLLTGSLRVKEKRRVLDLIAVGAADVVVGTHAIIQEGVTFRDLALVVADEQHRFGVGQRAALGAKGVNPHTLIMSATPIPRTLALILYGDLDISVIDELPPGRKAVKTYAFGEKMRERITNFIHKTVKQEKHQVYIVCPLIEETETSDLKNAEELSTKLQEQFTDITVGLLHGKMKPRLKDEIMMQFAEGKIDVLVSTTVIEVGVNVPNANVMIIENAERFGLSQLHQLRGRVGRGGDQAYCILFAHGSNEVTKKRMETMCISNDGFYISEQDLKLRGPGDFFGTRQHGLPEMKIANLFEDQDILKLAQEAAKEISEEGTDRYPLLKKRCEMVLDEDVVMN